MAEQNDRIPLAHSQADQLKPLFAMVRSRSAAERAQVSRLRASIAEIEQNKALLLKAVAVIDAAIKVVSASGIGVIESLVTSGLQLVFGDPTMSLSIDKKENVRGNSYELIGQKGDVRGPIMETFGGGVANVVSFLLRVILINRFQLARCLVIDESFNNVSAEYLPMVSEMLHQLSRARDYKILAVTHQPILAAAAGAVYRVVPNEHRSGSPTLVALTQSEMERLHRSLPETL